MRILVVGAGATGSAVIRQLQKNPSLKVLVADPRTDPPAVKEGLIRKVDYTEALTPLNMEHLLRRASPDLVLLATTARDLIDSRIPGADLLARSIDEELAAYARWPVVKAFPSA
jgi:ketopantoate reductase